MYLFSNVYMYNILKYFCNMNIAFNSCISLLCCLQQGVGIEFVRILPETHPPTLTNLFCECDTKDDVVSSKLVLKLYF